jgi:hypothetical protein
MVLITPQIEADPDSPQSGVLSVSFPDESECESFALPLCPTQTTLDSWKRFAPSFDIWIRFIYLFSSGLKK